MRIFSLFKEEMVVVGEAESLLAADLNIWTVANVSKGALTDQKLQKGRHGKALRRASPMDPDGTYGKFRLAYISKIRTLGISWPFPRLSQDCSSKV